MNDLIMSIPEKPTEVEEKDVSEPWTIVGAGEDEIIFEKDEKGFQMSHVIIDNEKHWDVFVRDIAGKVVDHRLRKDTFAEAFSESPYSKD